MKSSGNWKRPLVAGLMVVGLALPSAARAQITVGSPETEIEIGGSAGVTFSIAGTSNNAATVSDEIQFNAENLDIDCPGGICVGTSCALDSRLSATHILQATRPGGGDSIIFGVVDTTPPVATLTDGALFTCTFSAKAGAAEGSYALTSEFLEVADSVGDPLDSDPEYGALVVVAPPPTNTATPTLAVTNTPPPTNTPTRTHTPVPTNTRTVTPTFPPGGDDGCNMNPNAGSFPAWLLLPLVALPLLRARNRA